jgi:hypothetical protein
MGADGTFAVCRQIYNSDRLSATDKIVGLVLALARVHEQDFSRLSLATIMARTSLSERAIQRAVKSLDAEGICKRVRTGRAAMYRFYALGGCKSGRIVEADSVALQTRHTDAPDSPCRVNYPSPFKDPTIGEELGEYDER